MCCDHREFPGASGRARSALVKSPLPCALGVNFALRKHAARRNFINIVNFVNFAGKPLARGGTILAREPRPIAAPLSAPVPALVKSPLPCALCVNFALRKHAACRNFVNIVNFVNFAGRPLARGGAILAREPPPVAAPLSPGRKRPARIGRALG